MDENFANKTDETLQEEPITIDITVDRPGLLHKLGLKKKTRYFVIDPPPLRTLSMMSKEIENINFSEQDFEEVKKDENIFNITKKSLPHLNGKNYESLIRALVIAITHKKPSKKLMDFISDNMKPKELYRVVSMLIQRFDLSFFLLSLACLKGISVYESDSTPSNSSAEQSEQATTEKTSSTESPG